MKSEQSMAPPQIFLKALMLLDRGLEEKGALTLREALTEAEAEGDDITLVQVLVCLGDLLYRQGQTSDAQLVLSRALEIESADGVLQLEHENARKLLLKMKPIEEPPHLCQAPDHDT